MFMPIATIKQLRAPNAVATSDRLVGQVARIEDLAFRQSDGRKFFRRNHFAESLGRLVRRGFDRLAGSPWATTITNFRGTRHPLCQCRANHIFKGAAYASTGPRVYRRHALI